jgi:AcrR family transcriptional regulator
MKKPVNMAVDARPARGRPRSEKARVAILKAAADLIETGGVGAVSIEAVARHAGVGKPTVYRSWPNREALAMAALMASTERVADLRPTASVRDDLVEQLQQVVRVFATPRGRAVALMVASSESDSELAKAFRNQVMQASRESGRTLLTRAVAEGAIAAATPIDVVLDMVYGAIFYRLLMGHARIDAGFADQLVDLALGAGTTGGARL